MAAPTSPTPPSAPVEPMAPPATPPPQPAEKSRRWWYIGGSVVLVVFVIPALIGLILSLAGGKSSPQNNPGSNLKDVALTDNARINVNRLPSGQTLFFTMLQRTAQKTTIAGTYGEASYSDPNQPGKPITSKYQLRADTWSKGKLSGFNYADLAWNPSDTIITLQRCVDGKYSIYASDNASEGWQPQDAADTKVECTVNSQSTADGETTVDGLLTGGLSHNQAVTWVDLLAAAKDKTSGKPLFSFGVPQLTTLDGKPVISLSYALNNIWPVHLCDSTCGLNSLIGALQQVQIEPTDNGYIVDGLSDTATGKYYLDPATLLPVQSQMTTADSSGPATEYRRQFQFSEPDFTNTSTAPVTAVPTLIQGFVAIQDKLQAVPSQ